MLWFDLERGEKHLLYFVLICEVAENIFILPPGIFR